jgi:hypothetical protein
VHPLQRGGIFVGGGNLRIDYLPGRDHSFNVGVSLPVGQRFAGRTRARRDHVAVRDAEPADVPYEPEPSLSEAAANAGEIARWIHRLTVPYIDQWDGDRDDTLEEFAAGMGEIQAYLASDPGAFYVGPRTSEAEVRAYHSEMERAFSVAASGIELEVGGSTPLGRRFWDRARSIILDQVIFPYNRLLGQTKKEDTTRGYGTRAAAEFYEWLSTETPVAGNDGQRLTAVSWAFQRALDHVEAVRQAQEDTWGDSRFHFLPYQLVLKPSEHDSQEELDGILERGLQQSFWEGNEVFYIENEQFQVEFARMVLDAEDYSVLLIHDLRGDDGTGDPDEVAFRQVVNVYLQALLNAVRDYGRTGKIPQHIMLIDEWYFRANKGKMFTDLLEDPLHHELDLPDGFEDWEQEVVDLQAELRAAVARSPLLQGQAAQFPDGWIENVVKVHVNITNPADASFWTGEVLPLVGLPDVVARDHRKIAFADLVEEDPYKGRAIYTGMGLGEHYVGAAWEDRAIMARGPALLNLKTAARDVLIQQGFAADQIPWELRPRPLADDYREQVAAAVAAKPTLARAIDLHNDTGFAPKDVNLFKASLYTLLPAGSVIKAPDSIWNLPLWGSMMLGNALRGGRSLVIAPAIAHAPSAGFPQMSRAQELMARLVVAQEVFREHLDETGGLIKVGLYSPEMDVGNTPAKMRAVADRVQAVPWLGEFFDFTPETLDVLRTRADALEASGFYRQYRVEQKVKPAKLHLKANFFATPEAWDGLLDGPAATDLLAAYFDGVAAQNQAISEGSYVPVEELTEAVTPPAVAMTAAHLAELGPEAAERAAMYLAVGSHNQNSHSFVLAGEVAFVVSGWATLQGLPDFITLVGLSEWIEDLDQLEELFPRYTGLKRRIGRWFRIST